MWNPLERGVPRPYFPHPDPFIVEFLPGDFASRLVSVRVRFRRHDFAVPVVTYPPAILVI